MMGCVVGIKTRVCKGQGLDMALLWGNFQECSPV